MSWGLGQVPGPFLPLRDYTVGPTSKPGATQNAQTHSSKTERDPGGGGHSSLSISSQPVLVAPHSATHVWRLLGSHRRGLHAAVLAAAHGCPSVNPAPHPHPQIPRPTVAPAPLFPSTPTLAFWNGSFKKRENSYFHAKKVMLYDPSDGKMLTKGSLFPHCPKKMNFPWNPAWIQAKSTLPLTPNCLRQLRKEKDLPFFWEESGG